MARVKPRAPSRLVAWFLCLAAVLAAAPSLDARQPRPTRSISDYPGLARLFRDLAARPDAEAAAGGLFDFEQVLVAVTGSPQPAGHSLDEYRQAFAGQIDLRVAASRVVTGRDEAAYRLHSLGYSAREIADVLAGRIGRRALDEAQKMLMVGVPAERVSEYLDREYRRVADARKRAARRGHEAAGPSWAEALVARYAAMHGVSPALARAVAATESGWNPQARSAAGAVGLMQLMPGTARQLGVDPTRADQNVEGGVRYLAWLLRTFRGVEAALIAYNAGPGFAERFLRGEVALYGETREFVQKVLGRIAPSR